MILTISTAVIDVFVCHIRWMHCGIIFLLFLAELLLCLCFYPHPHLHCRDMARSHAHFLSDFRQGVQVSISSNLNIVAGNVHLKQEPGSRDVCV